jgi:hypothetical protein
MNPDQFSSPWPGPSRPLASQRVVLLHGRLSRVGPARGGLTCGWRSTRSSGSRKGRRPTHATGTNQKNVWEIIATVRDYNV